MKTVQLVSAGMDSYIINRLENPDVSLFIDNGSRYIETEKRFVERAGYKNLVILENTLNMAEMERQSAHIPMRNLYFILLAANYGDRIILGSTLGDRAIDTQTEFMAMATEILNYGLLEDKRTILVEAPYKMFTKSEYFKKFTDVIHKGDFTKSIRDIFENSISCYSPDENDMSCGLCKPCLRKYLSVLYTTGVDTSEYFINSPYEWFSKRENAVHFIEVELARFRDRESQENINLVIKMFL
jgi:hypothetical protein